MSMKFNRKPPLAKSPIRTRPRREVRSVASVSVHTPLGSVRKSAVLNGPRDAKKMGIRPEFDSMSCDLRALAQMVAGKNKTEGVKVRVGLSPVGANFGQTFERGRFYDLYSARRNERLKRKLGIELEDKKSKKGCSKYDLGIAAGTMKRRDSKRLENGRKSLPVDLKSLPPRSFLRSSKDSSKLLLSMSVARSYCVDDAGAKKPGSARRVARKI